MTGRLGAAVEQLGEQIAVASARVGQRVTVDAMVLDRADTVRLAEPGLLSANGSARLVQARDGWLALNLPRPGDWELMPAWLKAEAEDWDGVAAGCLSRAIDQLVADARVLGLAAAAVGETRPIEPAAARAGSGHRTRPIRVVDLSALWAGPLCAALLAAAGAKVVKIEHVGRPDPTGGPLAQRLNGGKRRLSLDFGDPDGRAALRAQLLAADVVVTAARPRAFEQLGLSPATLLRASPTLLWVAISAHGWGAGADRIGFGDDAAAAGGLVAWVGGEPRFLGDALADPLTGLAAAARTLAALGRGEAGLIDVSMAAVTATVAALPC